MASSARNSHLLGTKDIILSLPTCLVSRSLMSPHPQPHKLCGHWISPSYGRAPVLGSVLLQDLVSPPALPILRSQSWANIGSTRRLGSFWIVHVGSPVLSLGFQRYILDSCLP